MSHRIANLLTQLDAAVLGRSVAETVAQQVGVIVIGRSQRARNFVFCAEDDAFGPSGDINEVAVETSVVASSVPDACVVCVCVCVCVCVFVVCRSVFVMFLFACVRAAPAASAALLLLPPPLRCPF